MSSHEHRPTRHPGKQRDAAPPSSTVTGLVGEPDMQLPDEQHAGTDEPKQERPQNLHWEVDTTVVAGLTARIGLKTLLWGI
jgi:hypothetical protein